MQSCNAPLNRAVGFPTGAPCARINPCSEDSLLSGMEGQLTWELSIKMLTLAFFSDTFPFKIHILWSTVTTSPPLTEWVLIAAAIQRLKDFTPLWYLHLFHRYSPNPNRMAALCWFRRRYSSHRPVPGASSSRGVSPLLQLVTKRTFQAVIVKVLPLRALKDLLDLYFITMSSLVSTFIFQTFKIYSLRKTIFVFSSCIYTSHRMQAVCVDIKKTKK